MQYKSPTGSIAVPTVADKVGAKYLQVLKQFAFQSWAQLWSDFSDMVVMWPTNEVVFVLSKLSSG